MSGVSRTYPAETDDPSKAEVARQLAVAKAEIEHGGFYDEATTGAAKVDSLAARTSVSLTLMADLDRKLEALELQYLPSSPVVTRPSQITTVYALVSGAAPITRREATAANEVDRVARVVVPAGNGMSVTLTLDDGTTSTIATLSEIVSDGWGPVRLTTEGKAKPASVTTTLAPGTYVLTVSSSGGATTAYTVGISGVALARLPVGVQPPADGFAYEVRTAAQLREVLAIAQPGDRIGVSDGTYGDWGDIALYRSGLPGLPIVVRPITRHGVTFGTGTRFHIVGSYVEAWFFRHKDARQQVGRQVNAAIPVAALRDMGQGGTVYCLHGCTGSGVYDVLLDGCDSRNGETILPGAALVSARETTTDCFIERVQATGSGSIAISATIKDGKVPTGLHIHACLTAASKAGGYALHDVEIGQDGYDFLDSQIRVSSLWMRGGEAFGHLQVKASGVVIEDILSVDSAVGGGIALRAGAGNEARRLIIQNTWFGLDLNQRNLTGSEWLLMDTLGRAPLSFGYSGRIASGGGYDYTQPLVDSKLMNVTSIQRKGPKAGVENAYGAICANGWAARWTDSSPSFDSWCPDNTIICNSYFVSTGPRVVDEWVTSPPANVAQALIDKNRWLNSLVWANAASGGGTFLPAGDNDEKNVRALPQATYATKTLTHPLGTAVLYLRICLRFLVARPANLAVQVANAKAMLALAGIRLDIGNLADLDLPAHVEMDVIESGASPEMVTLAQQRGGMTTGCTGVFYIAAFTPTTYAGFAGPSIGGYGTAFVAQSASPWTLAHELGHVLGLDHVDDSRRLMTGAGTGNITELPPDLTEGEIATMRSRARKQAVTSDPLHSATVTYPVLAEGSPARNSGRPAVINEGVVDVFGTPWAQPHDMGAIEL